MRVIAMIAAYNEGRFIAACLEHLFAQGVEVYLIDNCSTDPTVEIAERYLGRGLLGIETFPRAGLFNFRSLLERKEELAAELDADWFIHVDADEIRLPPRADLTLAEAFAQVEAEGYNAVNFQEYAFVPTRESPDHDHPDFQRTMRWYYPYLPHSPHRLNAWQRRPARVELAWSGGHQVRFPGLRMYPHAFPMRHYLYLSEQHAIHKYVRRRHVTLNVQNGWHSWRAEIRPEMIVLPSQADLRPYHSDDHLDPSSPRQRHLLEEAVTAARAAARATRTEPQPAAAADDLPAIRALKRRRGPGPLVIGGIGGSGTRVFARLVRHAGLFIGTRLNLPEDPVVFPAFFDRWVNPFLARWPLPLPTADRLAMLRDFDALLAEHCAPLKNLARPWGWKEPRSIFLLPFFHELFPGLKFLHVLRDGRDLACTTTHLNNLPRHGEVLLRPDERSWSRPEQLMAIWNRVNLQAAEYAEQRLGDRYLAVRFEDLCARPAPTTRRVLDFFELDSDAAFIAQLEVAPPASIGRWREQPPETREALHRIGGPALRAFEYWRPE